METAVVYPQLMRENSFLQNTTDDRTVRIESEDHNIATLNKITDPGKYYQWMQNIRWKNVEKYDIHPMPQHHSKDILQNCKRKNIFTTENFHYHYCEYWLTKGRKNPFSFSIGKWTKNYISGNLTNVDHQWVTNELPGNIAQGKNGPWSGLGRLW